MIYSTVKITLTVVLFPRFVAQHLRGAQAMLSIFVGVVSAGVIMSCLTLAGKAGALLATAILAVFCVSNILGGGNGGNKASDFSSK